MSGVRCTTPKNWISTQVVPTEPKTLGDHIKRRRLQLRMLQADLAKRLGVHVESLRNWERGSAEPMVRQIPKIIEFLAYNPEPELQNRCALIRHHRRRLGWTQKAVAERLGIDAVSLYRWEP